MSDQHGGGPPPDGGFQPPRAGSGISPKILISVVSVFLVVVGGGAAFILSSSHRSSPPPSTGYSYVNPALGNNNDLTGRAAPPGAPTAIGNGGQNGDALGKKIEALYAAKNATGLVNLGCAGSGGFDADAVTQNVNGDKTFANWVQSVSNLKYKSFDGSGELTFSADRTVFGFTAAFTYTVTVIPDSNNNYCVHHTDSTAIKYVSAIAWPAAGAFPAAATTTACGPGVGSAGVAGNVLNFAATVMDSEAPSNRIFIEDGDLQQMAICAPGLQVQLVKLINDPVPESNWPLDTGQLDVSPVNYKMKTGSGQTVSVTLAEKGTGLGADYFVTALSVG